MTSQDIPALYRICLQTALNGGDASDFYGNPDLIGHIFAGPYAVGESTFGFVAADDLGVAGYVVCAADTAAFEQWAERDWWPALRARYPDPGPADVPDAGAQTATPTARDARLIRLIHHPSAADPRLYRDYPAHLHIDLLPRAQGTGAGRRLMAALVGELSARGVPGVFLGVGKANAHAVGFYRHLGFVTVREDADTFWLGLRTDGVGTAG